MDEKTRQDEETRLLAAIAAALPRLERIWQDVEGIWDYEDSIYRFYHQSLKVFRLQGQITQVVETLRGLAPHLPLNPWFMQIVAEAKPAEELRKKVGQLARAIVTASKRASGRTSEGTSGTASEPTSEALPLRTSDYRILVISCKGDEIAPESLPAGSENPLIVRIRRECSKALPGFERIWNISLAVEAFCKREPVRNHLVFVDDADYYFYPSSQLGRFTEELDNNEELIEQIISLGECLAGYEGHLVLAAALHQRSTRMRRFVDDKGWSWVRYYNQGFELICGRLPDVLKDYCGPKQDEPVSEIGAWPKPMTIKQIANRYGCGRAKMSRLLHEWLETKPNLVRKFGGEWQVRLDELPPRKPQQ
jgi:hypothetical protein